MKNITYTVTDRDEQPLPIDLMLWRNGHLLRIAEYDSATQKVITLFPDNEILEVL